MQSCSEAEDAQYRDWSLITGRGEGGLQNGRGAC